MLKPGQYSLIAAVEIVLDFNNRRYRFFDLTEKLQADSANMLGHAVQDKARRGDDAVATFFLDAR